MFYGSFDAAAAHAIADGHGDPADVTRLLLYLVDRFLVTAEPNDGTTGYRLLETLRGYGLERLAEQGRLDAAPGPARAVGSGPGRAGRTRPARRRRSQRWATSVERHFEVICGPRTAGSPTGIPSSACR